MSGRRFGGRYSPAPPPEGAPPPGAPPAGPPPHPFDGRRPTRAGFRANLLFVLPFLPAWRGFAGSPGELALGLGAFALMMLAAWLTREGILAQEAFEARAAARRPAFPRKILGALAMGAGLGLATVLAGQGPAAAAGLGVIAALLHLASFGPDPLRDKGLPGIDAFQSGRVASVVEEGERHLAAMREAIARSGERTLEARVDRFAATARALFCSVEAAPGDLTAARRYLGVYLMGARDATARFADIWARSRDPQALADYTALLDDLEGSFAARSRALLESGRSDLDVEIAVLRERLKREG